MKLKKTALLIFTTTSIAFLSACGGEPEIDNINNQANPEITTEAEETQLTQAPKKDRFLNNYKDYSEFNLEQVEEDDLNQLISETINEYETLLESQYDMFQTHIDQIKTDITNNINDFKQTKLEAESDYDDNCKRRNEGNNDACDDIQESIVELENRIGELETRISNEVGEIEAERVNQLNTIKTRMLNNVGNLLVQGGYEVN